ncbi:hypothetical protein H6P81_008786 [Aristolochia fimbriata]|uniref:BHLH domain-containing protein n=1 Tax=Aristolochia fimbriata TaxID=158543 RepID=A0AAV7EK95_ARIFI|nr:hypothetical protein H6P81_008786 [Aristolochia fimbriata]
MGGSVDGLPAGKPDRKTVERRRRMQMNSLCLKLASLVPKDSSTSRRRLLYVDGEEISETLLQETLSKPDLFEQAVDYIKNLQKRMEVLNAKKEEAALARNYKENIMGAGEMALTMQTAAGSVVNTAFPPVVEVRESNSILEVFLVDDRLHCKFTMSQVVKVLEDEGAEIVHAQYSALASDKVFLVLHAKATVSRLGVEGESVLKKLKQLCVQ